MLASQEYFTCCFLISPESPTERLKRWTGLDLDLIGPGLEMEVGLITMVAAVGAGAGSRGGRGRGGRRRCSLVRWQSA